jgi:Cu+-exporting ATPase
MRLESNPDEAKGCPHCGPAEPAPVTSATPSASLSPSAPATRRPSTAKYVCPMHPEIGQDDPGTCSLCGMALEPRVITLAEGPNPELADMVRRLRVSVLPAGIVVLLGMSQHLLAPMVSARVLSWVEWALATPVVLWAGWPFFERGAVSIVRRNLNMFTLIALGTGAAYFFSVVATIAPGIFPATLRGADGGVDVYFEAAAVITVLVLVGQVLELRARQRTGSAIRSLLELAPTTARRISDRGEEADVPLDDVRRGDRLRVRPGERVPCDGVVLEGSSSVEEAMVTGEPMPAAKSTGSPVTGGTLNGTGAFVMRAERVGKDALLAQIVRLVGEAQRSRAPMQRLADRVASYFVPAVVAAALLTAVVWMVVGPEPRAAHAFVNAVAVLIIACPCALGLATPMSIVVGVGRGATMGVLFRDAEAIETLGAIDTLVIDKTGTLTEGRPRVVSVVAAPGFVERELLRLAAALERGSEHPLAAAILAKATALGIALDEASGFRAVPGKGIVGHIGGKAVGVGNRALLEDLDAPIDGIREPAESGRAEGQTVVFVAVDGRVAGFIGIADAIKESARDAVLALRADGIHLVMLTGDTRSSALVVARALGIDEIEADVLPAQKAEVIRRLKAGGHRVAMAGDGVNDAPALAAADVGIAMGNGTDVAIESAGVVLVHGDLDGIRRARALSRATAKNITQNLVLAFVYNAVGIPIAAGVLYPALGWQLGPMLASAAMSLSSVSVITNALRLGRVRLGNFERQSRRPSPASPGSS